MKKLAVFLMMFFLISNVYSQEVDTVEYKFKAFATLGIDFMVHNSIWGGTVPAIPEEATVSIAGTQYYAPAFGININYHFLENLSFYFDINMYKRKTPVAYNGGYASSMWIFEQTDYSSYLVGPFSEDVFYNVNTTGFRLGLKAYLQHEKKVQPWIGAYWGYYSVVHGIFNKDNTKNYGSGNDYISGLSYLNIGVDIWDKSKTFGVSLFFEMGAPVYSNYTIENCLVNGWNYSGIEGEHIFGSNRIGIAIITKSSNKK
ncbi:MAG: hypothetical protein U9Q83_08110 [Bacteroidota bacterium]|nr:hypothetical protein [Bacteroidota bacterium]